MLERVILPGADSAATLGKQFDFQFAYEHNARATAATNPDYRYVDLPDEINMSDPAKDAYYKEHAVVVLPGLGTPRSARTIAVPATHVAWGITLMKEAPNKDNAIKFLQLLLGPAGMASLNENGPAPITPALVSPADLQKLPESLRSLVKTTGK
jgi:molybdate/tungstate transport system substrate-binding protein